jgi:hypothetical protein
MNLRGRDGERTRPSWIATTELHARRLLFLIGRSVVGRISWQGGKESAKQNGNLESAHQTVLLSGVREERLGERTRWVMPHGTFTKSAWQFSRFALFTGF